MADTETIVTWQTVRQEIDRLLGEHSAELRALHSFVAAYFEERSAGQTYARRPNLSLRLVALGEPPAMLVIVPGCSYR
jgi:hypothetical protein